MVITTGASPAGAAAPVQSGPAVHPLTPAARRRFELTKTGFTGRTSPASVQGLPQVWCLHDSETGRYIFMCRFCRKVHRHSAMPGPRRSHCWNQDCPSQYYLEKLPEHESEERTP